MSKKQEMREEAKAAIIEELEYGYTGYYCDLHDVLFNTDYYIIGTYRAKQALEEYGIWDAIKDVQTYEKERFGGVFTDLSNPEHLLSMLYYIIGEEVLYELKDEIDVFRNNWYNKATEETNAEILKAIKEKQKAG